MQLARLGSLPILLLTFTASPAQDILHYKFDDACNNKVTNYAAGSPAASEGTITSTLAGAPASSWIPGPFGTALQGGSTVAPVAENWINTGWSPGTVSGSLTWATWLRMRPTAPTPTLTYLMGDGAGFRVFTGGGGFFLTAGWGGGNVNTSANVQTLARAGWTHIALVLDGASLTGTYYINGTPEAPVAMSGPVNWTGSSFFVGKHSSPSYPNIFDFDEFVLSNRAMSPAEISALASGARAGDGDYGSGGCGTLEMASSGGPPVVGSLTYALTLDSPSPAGFSIILGSNRCQVGGLPLPFDLGSIVPGTAGCLLETSADLGSFAGAKPAGLATFVLGVPAMASLSGVTVFAQAPAFDAGSGGFVISNAFSIGIGN